MLLEHSSVIDCAVFGVDDPLLGETVTAILVLDSDNEVRLWVCGLHGQWCYWLLYAALKA